MKAGNVLIVITVVALATATYFVLSQQTRDAPEAEGTAADGDVAIDVSESESAPRRSGNSQEVAESHRERLRELQDERSRGAVEAGLTLETLRNRMANVGVNPQALDSYKREAHTAYQMTAWGELRACVQRFHSKIEPFKFAASTMTKSYDASVTEGGQTMGVGPMTCVEILWSSANYDQRPLCEQAQSDLERHDAELLEIHSECAEFARRAGLFAEQVEEIFQLP